MVYSDRIWYEYAILFPYFETTMPVYGKFKVKICLLDYIYIYELIY